MSDAVTDTHALIWYLEDSPRLSSTANQTFEQCDRWHDAICYTIVSG